MDQTPASLGYRMPAEWEPHAATWIAWPHNRDDWPGKFTPIGWVYTEIVRHLSLVERVHIVVSGRAMKDASPISSISRVSTSSLSDSSKRPPIGAGFATPLRHSSSRTTTVLTLTLHSA